MSAYRTVTYRIIMDDIWPKKSETHLTQLTFEENIINFPGDVKTPIADITTSKLIFNSVLSTKNWKFMSAEIANL